MKKILAAFLLVVLAGCNSMGPMGVGNEKFDPAWIRQHVVVGKTTQQDILTLYGEPDHKGTDSSVVDAWKYSKNGAGSNALSYVTSFIPGVDTANQAANMAGVHQKGATNDDVVFWFKKGVLTSWQN
jgi:hypothetical protein